MENHIRKSGTAESLSARICVPTYSFSCIFPTYTVFYDSTSVSNTLIKVSSLDAKFFK